jgi:cbb3-type cytochrome oxidase subunit 3
MRTLRIIFDALFLLAVAVILIAIFAYAFSEHSSKALASQNYETTKMTEDLGISIYVQKRPVTYDSDRFWYVTVTNRMPIMSILGISVNRGNCKPSFADEHKTVPVPLLYGETVKMMVTNCNPIEVTVRARQGSATVNLSE